MIYVVRICLTTKFRRDLVCLPGRDRAGLSATGVKTVLYFRHTVETGPPFVT